MTQFNAMMASIKSATDRMRELAEQEPDRFWFHFEEEKVREAEQSLWRQIKKVEDSLPQRSWADTWPDETVGKALAAAEVMDRLGRLNGFDQLRLAGKLGWCKTFGETPSSWKHSVFNIKNWEQ